MSNHVLWNAQTKAIINIFWTQFFLFFFHFRTHSRRVVFEGGGGQGGGGVSHIGAGIILSASCSFSLFCFMFKVVSLLFQFMVWNLREVSVCT